MSRLEGHLEIEIVQGMAILGLLFAPAALLFPQISMAEPPPYMEVAKCYATYFELEYASTTPVPARLEQRYHSEAEKGLKAIKTVVNQAASKAGDEFFRYASSTRTDTRRAIALSKPGSAQLVQLTDNLYKDAISCDAQVASWNQ